MFNNLTIKSRLTFVIGFQSLLLVVIGVTGLSGINQSNEGLEQVDRKSTRLNSSH